MASSSELERKVNALEMIIMQKDEVILKQKWILLGTVIALTSVIVCMGILLAVSA